ncbi:hypothetical protein CUT44_18825 [Streptomyces carminius]|uniref:DUF2812 domain-containing protein n=1 Tax=Streptomyces carminius TaxID=2665496 RepID=A0A2M8LX45_9ACTN|nr:hypothetical protein [Streptomyces carminius]PJE96536.1 hypothetical protein CUT44_18825 [Streptomyces carminius]
MDAYFTDLAERLRARGVAEERVTVTLTELHDHLLDADSTPEAEFGPVAEFAEQLARGTGASAPEAAGQPGSRAQEWRWTADIYTDRELLNRYGGQGWEVERVDRLGQFVCRRDPGNAMRWEYRRETTLRGERGKLAARLAPDGWEPCGRWAYLAYFKRPCAVTAGPAAALAAAPEVPGRRVFFSRKYRALLMAVLALLVAEAVYFGNSDISLGDPATLAGMVVGALAGGAGAAYGLRRHLRKERSAGQP